MSRTFASMALLVALGAVPARAAAQAPAAADTREANLTAYVELLRSDLRAEKVAIHTELLGLTDAEDVAFWPLYRQYEAELAKLNDERIAMIGEYSDHIGSVTDALADSLALKAIDIERRRTELLAKYYDRMKSALSPKTAVRFLQVEHQLLLLMDLQIAAALPVVK